MPPRKPTSKRPVRFIETGWWTLCSCLMSGLIGFVVLTELRAGPIFAGLTGLAAYALLAYLLPARLSKTEGAPERLDAAAGPLPDTDDPRVDLLVEAHTHLATLAATRPHLPAALALVTQSLENDGRAILESVTQAPEKLHSVLRFFTYYLPSTADLVMDRVRLAPHAGQARLEEIDHTLQRLMEAFAGFRTALLQPELTSVDIDISLLDTALDSDLEELKTR